MFGVGLTFLVLLPVLLQAQKLTETEGSGNGTENGQISLVQPSDTFGGLVGSVAAESSTDGNETDKTNKIEEKPKGQISLVQPTDTFAGLVGDISKEETTSGGNETTTTTTTKDEENKVGLMPEDESFAQYLNSVVGTGVKGAPEGEKGEGGGSEDPLEPGEPTWAPKCPADWNVATQKPIQAINAVSPPANCIDNHELCPFWESRGWCKKAPKYMKTHCPGACDTTCDKKFIQFDADECKDKRPECSEFVSAGHCSITPFFMIWQCPLSCKFCDSSKVPFVFEYTVKEFFCMK